MIVRRFDKIPGVVTNERSELFFCGLEPFVTVLPTYCLLPRLGFVRFGRRSFS